MNTEQNYVGGGNYANNPTPKAKNGLQPPSTPDDWRDDFLLYVGEDKERKRLLFGLLNVVRDQAWSDDPVPMLTYFLKNFVDDRYVRLEAKENRKRINQLTDLITFFLELKELYDDFYGATDYDGWEDEKEVSHE